MSRKIITESQLDELVNKINAAAGMPAYHHPAPYLPGQYIRCPAYGGHQIQKVITSGGCIEAMTPGFMPKRDVYEAGLRLLRKIEAANA